MLTPREIIAESWKITTSHRQLKQWGFWGSLFRLLLDIKLIAYQLYFMYAIFITKEEVGMFDDVIWLYDHVTMGLFVTIMVSFCILLLIEFFMPSLSDGAIIGLAAKAHNKAPVSGGVVLAMYNFFPILAIHEIFIFSGINMLITAVSLIIRYAGGLATPLIFIAIVVWAVSTILKFFSSFAEPAVVIDKSSIFDAIGRSIKLIVSYLGHVIFLVLLMLIISLRIFINTIIIVLIPAVVFGFGLLMTHILSPVISYTIAGIIGLVLVVITAYFMAYLHVFKQTVWTILYMEMKKEKDLDHIGS
jgi:hypothetical protein